MDLSIGLDVIDPRKAVEAALEPGEKVVWAAISLPVSQRHPVYFVMVVILDIVLFLITLLVGGLLEAFLWASLAFYHARHMTAKGEYCGLTPREAVLVDYNRCSVRRIPLVGTAAGPLQIDLGRWKTVSFKDGFSKKLRFKRLANPVAAMRIARSLQAEARSAAND